MPSIVRNFGVGDVFVGDGTNTYRLGSLQNASVEFSWEQKELYGANQFPEAIFRGKGKVSGKASYGSFNGALLSSLLTGATSATGRPVGVVNESTGAIAAATYTATNPTGFVDKGVIDENGYPMTNVASGPAAGEYAVSSSGVYTFDTSANGKTYKVSYSYTVATGLTTTYANQLMGSGATYRLDLYNTEQDGSKIGITLFAVTIPKLSIPFKNDDVTIMDIDFAAAADSSGNVFAVYTP